MCLLWPCGAHTVQSRLPRWHQTGLLGAFKMSTRHKNKNPAAEPRDPHNYQYSSSFQKSISMPLCAYRACFLKMRPVLRPFIRPYMSINVLKIHFWGASKAFSDRIPARQKWTGTLSLAGLTQIYTFCIWVLQCFVLKIRKNLKISL